MSLSPQNFTIDATHANQQGADVTIGMPVYNGAGLLEQAISSLSEQTLRGCRILVSDNASTDATPQLLADWAQRDCRVCVYRQPKNIGASGNFEWLVRNASTPYFMFAAHDDGWSPDYASILSQAISQAGDIGLAVGETTLMTSDWQPIRKTRLPKSEAVLCFNAVKRQIRNVRAGWFYGLYRRDVLKEALPRMQSYGHIWGNDFILLLPILLSHRVAIAPAAKFYQRTTASSDTLYRPPLANDRWTMHRAAQRECFNALLEAPLTPLQKALLAPSILAYAARHSFKIRDILWHRMVEGGRIAR